MMMVVVVVVVVALAVGAPVPSLAIRLLRPCCGREGRRDRREALELANKSRIGNILYELPAQDGAKAWVGW